MSTRATYEIDRTTFYIHHDGYLEGAAYYFWLAIREYSRLAEHDCHLPFEPAGDGFKGAFYRANRKAEITESHAAHGDTEYRYTLNTADMLLTIDAGDDLTIVPLAEFVNEHCPRKWFVNKPFDFTYAVKADRQIMTAENGRIAAKECRRRAEEFSVGNLNREAYFSDAEKIESAINSTSHA